MKTGLCLLAVVAGFATSVPAFAENKVVTCSTWRARAAGPSGGPALVANVPRAMSPIDLNAVQYTDRKLGRSVIVEGLFAQRTPTNGLRVMARFVNCTSKPLTVQVRSNFMDENQMPTEKVSAWRTVFLSPRATGVYEESSIATTTVAAYLIELRPNL